MIYGRKLRKHNHRRCEGARIPPCFPRSPISNRRCIPITTQESIADSDGQDGELRKMLTSPLYGQESNALVKLAVLFQERGASAKRTQADRMEGLMSNSSQETRATVKPIAIFSPECKSSVLKKAKPSNLWRSLLEGNTDHLLSQAKSDPMKQQLQVESLNNWIGELQRQTYAQRLELQDAQYGFVESRREQVRLQEELSMKEKVLRNTQIRSMHEMGQMKRAQELRVDEVSVPRSRENHEIIQPLPNCKKCKNRWILWAIHGNFRKWNRIIVEDCLTFPVILQWFQVLVPCWAATNACLLTHGIHLDYRKTFLVINFLRLIHSEIIIKEFNLTMHKENVEQSQKLQGQDLFFTRDDKQNRGTIPMPTFARRPSTMSSSIPVEFPQNSMVDSKDSKNRKCNSINSIHFLSSYVGR